MSDRMNDLQDEAKQLSESFSPALHARIMAKVRAEAKPLATRQFHPLRYALAAAAIIVVVFVMKAALIHPPLRKQEVANRGFNLPNPLPKVAIALNDDAGNPAYGYLDHDAKALGQYVVKQLDVMPSLP